ncbi:MAG: polysaccharide biosynthesis C-terminal domain-containing protein, partial [Oscillospiraceae bacterium]
FASLLIPKLTREQELGHKNAVAYITKRAVSSALTFGVITAAIFFAFSDLWGLAFYQNKDAGRYIGILAPLVPLLYLDVVMDCLLKGLDEQLNSMKYNIMDSGLRVVLILIFMGFFGIRSYIAIIFFSAIFNGFLSMRKVVQATNLQLGFLKQLFYQIPAAMFAVAVSSVLAIPLKASIPLLVFHLLVAYGIYGTLNSLFRSLQKKD